MNNKNYERYKNKMSKIADIRHAIAVLNWDQEVFLPKNSAPIRAQQISTLSGMAHELFISEEIGNLIEKLSDDESLNFKEKANIRETKKAYEDATKLPKVFVIKLSETISQAFADWKKAKEANDYKLFENALAKLVDLNIEGAELKGFEGHIYNAMLDTYEYGSTVETLDLLFGDVKNQLKELLNNIQNKEQVDDSFLYQHFDKDKQWKLGIDVLKQIGYDFKSGRQDISAHPFTTTFNSNDVRVTTRIDENNFNEMLWSCIHEGGHALYEQGLPIEEYGLPGSQFVSLGIHESQSRLWENNVGRSLSFWKHQYPNLKKVFPSQFENVSLNSFYKAINKVEPSLIRTNADELTYHFHVLIRYEIEKDLIEGNIAVQELPEVWNHKYKSYLNVDVPDHSQGVLQDIHWAHGSFGYFPTYSVGSIYAAQFFNKATEEITDLDLQIQKGDTRELLHWLRTKIHQHGMTYKADELCEKITGEKLNFSHFMNYANKKYGEIYDL